MVFKKGYTSQSKKKKLKKICKGCGKEFYVVPSKKHINCCSWKCSGRNDLSVERIKNLYLDGNSIWQISSLLKADRSTISTRLKRANVKITRSRPKKIVCKLNKLTPSLSWLYGVLCGDGFLYNCPEKNKYYLGLDVADKEFVQKFQDVIKDVFGEIHITRFIRKRKFPYKDMYYLRIASKKVVYELLNLTSTKDYHCKLWRVPKEILNNKLLVGSFLRGFYDSEGSVYLPIGCQSVSCCSTNYKGICEIKRMLKMLGISSYLQLKGKGREVLYVITIKSLGNFRLFNKYIGFTIFRKQKRLDQIIYDQSHSIQSIKRDLSKSINWEEVLKDFINYKKPFRKLNIKVNLSYNTIRYHAIKLVGLKGYKERIQYFFKKNKVSIKDI